MIELNNIFKIYKTKINNDVYALKDFSYTFPNNGFYQLRGHSGSGKTTLLGIIGGLLRPDKGQIKYNGLDLINLSEKELDEYRASSVAFVFQQYCLFDELDVIENVKLACPIKDANEKAKECLKLVGLEGYEHRRINELSGGQKQRVSIARALAKDAKIILADEPTAALDKENSISLLSLLKELSKDRLIIFSSHENELLIPFNPIILDLDNGELINKQSKIIEDKNETDIQNKPLLKRRLFSFGKGLFKKHSVRSSLMSILLALTSSLGVFAFSLFQFNSVSTSKSIMLNTGENSISCHREISNYAYTSYSKDEIMKLQTSNRYTVLPLINPNDNPDTPIVSFTVNDPNTVNLKDYKYSFSPGFCEYDNFIEASFPLICGKKPTNDNEILISNYTYDRFANYGFGSSIRKEEIQSMDNFLSMNLQLYILGSHYKIVGIVNCGNDSKDNKEINFDAPLNKDNVENYYYSYGKSSPRNVLFIKPNAKYSNLTSVMTTLVTDVVLPGNETKIRVANISKELGNSVQINADNHYGMSIYALSKILPYTLVFKDSTKLTDYSAVFNWGTKFSSLNRFNSDISFAKLFSKTVDKTSSYLSILACGEYVKNNGLPDGEELDNLKDIATNFYKSINKNYDFSVLNDETTDLLKSFYVALLSSTALDPNSSHMISGLYNSKGKQITFDYLASLKDVLSVSLASLNFEIRTTYEIGDIDIKQAKIGYLNLEDEVRSLYHPANNCFNLYADEEAYKTYTEEFGLTTQYKKIIVTGLDDINLINNAIENVESLNYDRTNTTSNNGAIAFCSPMKDYLETTSFFSFFFALILSLISVILMLFFMLSIEKSEEKNLMLVRCFGYNKYEAIIPLVTIPLIASIISFVLSTIFATFVNIFGNSYIGSLFGINAIFISTNPLFLVLTILIPLVLSLLSLIIPIIKLRKRDMLSVLN